MTDGEPLERLQKVLAHAGVASRRRAEELILAGHVTVNGQVVRELGVKVNPRRSRIAIDGKRVAGEEPHVYLLLHKPVGYVSTAQDTHGRPTVLDLVPRGARLYPVGRLDAESEGLLLLTNDGELAYRLTHPRFEVERAYLALVRGRPRETELAVLRRGVRLEDGFTAPAAVRLAHPPTGEETAPGTTWVHIVIHEGRKRQVRRMCEAIGHPVLRLIRNRLGPISLGDLPAGGHRPLTPEELARLRTTVGLK